MERPGQLGGAAVADRHVDGEPGGAPRRPRRALGRQREPRELGAHRRGDRGVHHGRRARDRQPLDREAPVAEREARDRRLQLGMQDERLGLARPVEHAVGHGDVAVELESRRAVDEVQPGAEASAGEGHRAVRGEIPGGASQVQVAQRRPDVGRERGRVERAGERDRPAGAVSRVEPDAGGPARRPGRALRVEVERRELDAQGGRGGRVDQRGGAGHGETLERHRAVVAHLKAPDRERRPRMRDERLGLAAPEQNHAGAPDVAVDPEPGPRRVGDREVGVEPARARRDRHGVGDVRRWERHVGAADRHVQVGPERAERRRAAHLHRAAVGQGGGEGHASRPGRRVARILDDDAQRPDLDARLRVAHGRVRRQLDATERRPPVAIGQAARGEAEPRDREERRVLAPAAHREVTHGEVALEPGAGGGVVRQGEPGRQHAALGHEGVALAGAAEQPRQVEIGDVEPGPGLRRAPADAVDGQRDGSAGEGERERGGPGGRVGGRREVAQLQPEVGRLDDPRRRHGPVLVGEDAAGHGQSLDRVVEDAPATAPAALPAWQQVRDVEGRWPRAHDADPRVDQRQLPDDQPPPEQREDAKVDVQALEAGEGRAAAPLRHREADGRDLAAERPQVHVLEGDRPPQGGFELAHGEGRAREDDERLADVGEGDEQRGRDRDEEDRERDQEDSANAPAAAPRRRGLELARLRHGLASHPGDDPPARPRHPCCHPTRSAPGPATGADEPRASRPAARIKPPSGLRRRRSGPRSRGPPAPRGRPAPSPA